MVKMGRNGRNTHLIITYKRGKIISYLYDKQEFSLCNKINSIVVGRVENSPTEEYQGIQVF